MTMLKRSADAKKSSSRTYYGFAMKQNWQLCALFIILTLFIMLLASYISIDYINDYVARYDYPGSLETITAEKIETRVHSRMSDVSVIGILVGAGLAFISGMTAMSYVNSKKSVGCYHSFPIKRESMFVTETTIPMVYFLLSITAGYAISFLMFAFSFDSALAMGGLYIRAWFTSIVLFLFIYTVILLAGGLTGTTAMKLIMTLFLLFWPLVMYTLIIYMLDINTELEISYYTSTEAYMFISPLVRAINSIVEMYSTAKLTCGFPLIMSAAMYVGAMLLHKYRKSELSGTTVVWKPMFAFVKYAVIFAAAHLGALLFYYMGDESYVTMFFGAVFGAVVALMLMNAIMYRSTRAMFKNMKKFFIFLLATIVFIILVPLNVTGLIGLPYPTWYTRSIELIVDDYTLEYTDREDIEAIEGFSKYVSNTLPTVRYIYSDDIEEMEKLMTSFPYYTYDNSEKYGYYDEYGYYHESSELVMSPEDVIESTKELYAANGSSSTATTWYTTKVQKPFFGIPVAKSRNFDVNSAGWEYISRTEEYLAQYDLPGRIGDKEVTYLDFDILGRGAHFSVSNNSGLFEDTIDKLISACVLKHETNDDHIYLGAITIEYKSSKNAATSYYENVSYPVFSCDIEILNILGELTQIGYPKGEDKIAYETAAFLSFDSEEDVLDFIMNNITASAIVDATSGETHFINEYDTARELLTYTSSICTNNSYRGYKRSQFIRESGTHYNVLVNLFGNQLMLRFRQDSVTETELDAIFDSLK